MRLTSIGKVATVLTVYGIETHIHSRRCRYLQCVATVLTVYGIETVYRRGVNVWILELQQYLPFTVLKLLVAYFSPPT